MPLIDLTNENFDDMIDAHKIAILDFWAPWCAPCKGFAPVFEAAALEHPDILFAKVDTESEPVLAKQFEIQSIPTLLGSVDGTIAEVRMGALSPVKLEALIQKLRKA